MPSECRFIFKAVNDFEGFPICPENLKWLCRYLQEAFDVIVVIQLTDDYVLRKNLTVEERQTLARENAKDIIACGFDMEKTFIFYIRDYFGE